MVYIIVRYRCVVSYMCIYNHSYICMYTCILFIIFILCNWENIVTIIPYNTYCMWLFDTVTIDKSNIAAYQLCDYSLFITTFSRVEGFVKVVDHNYMWNKCDFI